MIFNIVPSGRKGTGELKLNLYAVSADISVLVSYGVTEGKSAKTVFVTVKESDLELISYLVPADYKT